jgi:von Willebrand factor type A domain-containing protein
MRIARMAAAVVAGAAVLIGGCPAVAAVPGITTSPDEIYAAVGSDLVPADFVFLVDVSAAMNAGAYARVREGLAGFFASLAPADRVTLIPYAATATATTHPVEQSPGQLLATLPVTTGGDRADVGAALSEVVETLAGRRDQATVVLLTAGRGTAGDLRKVARAARKLRQPVQAYAIPVAAGTDAAQLAKVWPRATVLTGDLGTELAEPMAASRAAKARGILSAEVKRPVRIVWPNVGINQGTSVTNVQVKSPMTYIPLTLAGLTVSSDNPQVRVSVPAGPVELPPGGTATVPVTAHWDAGPRNIRPLYTVNGFTSLELSGRVTSPWSAGLSDDLDLPLDSAWPATPVDRELSAQRGSLWYWLLGVIVVVAVIELVRAVPRQGNQAPSSSR